MTRSYSTVVAFITVCTCIFPDSSFAAKHEQTTKFRDAAVVVCPFKNSSHDDQKKDAVRDFESLYFSYCLIRALNAMPGQGVTYFSCGPTPAADYVIEGAILVSDGKHIKIHISAFSILGKQVLSRTYGVSFSTDKLAATNNPLKLFWKNIAVQMCKMKCPSAAVANARVYTYLHSDRIPANEMQRAAALAGAETERSLLLEPLTTEFNKRASLGEEIYSQWLYTSCDLIEQRSHERAMEAADIFLGVLAGLGAAGAQVSGDSDAQVSLTNTALDNVYNAETTDSNAAELNNTLQQLQQLAFQGNDTLVAVQLFGKIYQLNGSITEQQRQLHEMVRNVLASMPAN